MAEPLAPPPGVPVAPILADAVLQSELGRIFQQKHRSNLVAFFGTGRAGTLVANGITFEVIPTSCELEMRSRMPGPAEMRSHKGMVFLVDWQERLPMDLAARVAHGRLRKVARDTHLAAIFGARELDGRLLGTALASTFLADAELARRVKKVSGQLLSYHDAYARFLDALTGFPVDDGVPVDRFLEWCITNGDGAVVRARLNVPNAGAQLAKELESFALEKHGQLGLAAWLAWLDGEGELFWHYALLVQAVQAGGADGYASGVLAGSVKKGHGFGAALLAAKTDVTDATIRAVAGRLKWQPHQLKKAAQLIDDPQFQASLVRSVFLPAGLDARRAALATVLSALVVSPTEANLEAARARHDDVKAHVLQDNQAEARDMGLRLAAFLVEDLHPRTQAPSAASYQRAVDLAEWYARDGGFVDHARHHIRAVREGPYAQALQSLVTRLDLLRDEKDKAFADGLQAWLASDQPMTQVLPIAEVSKRVLGPFLGEIESRKILVVLMDGMSHADTVHLRESLELEPARWLPANWRPKTFADGRGGHMPPVMAAMPSVTNVSRAAFFAGKQGAWDVDESTGKDIRRWAQNKNVSPFVAPDKTPTLLLKDQLGHEGGLSQVAGELISGPDRIVAVVVNAIDDDLKGSSQVHNTYGPKHIPLLRSLLAYAEHSGRVVMLISDHGHVPSDRMTTRGPKGDVVHSRWRGLGPKDQPEPFEVVLTGKNVSVPKGHERVAVIWDERAVYGPPGAGAHGGAALAESLCPMLLLTPASLSDTLGSAPDDALRQLPRYEPDWWSFKANIPGVRSAVTPPVAPAPPPKQPALFAEFPTTTKTSEKAPAPTKPSLAALVEKLMRSSTFKATAEGRSKEKVKTSLEHLSHLVDAGDQMSEADFARRLEIPAFRASGPIVELQTLLNVEGYQVVEYDRAGKQLRLNRALLLQMYEVEK